MRARRVLNSGRRKGQRRDTLEAAVQADPGLLAIAVGLWGIPDDSEGRQLHGLCYLQDTLGVAGPLDDVLLDDLEQCFITVVKVQLRLASAHAKLCTLVLGLLNQALGHDHQTRTSETSNSLLRAINFGIPCRLCCIHKTDE